MEWAASLLFPRLMIQRRGYLRLAQPQQWSFGLLLIGFGLRLGLGGLLD